MVALTVTVPALDVYNVLPLIVAPVEPAFTTLHVIVLLVAVVGVTVPVSVNDAPALTVAGTPVMFVTGVCGDVTVMLKS